MSHEMSKIPPHSSPVELDDKVVAHHDDMVSDDKVDMAAGTDTFQTSAFAGWGKAKLLRTFWRLCLTGLAVSSGGM